MSLQGIWADHIVIQSVADAMNLKIYIIESDGNFRDTTIVEPANTIDSTISIFIGHIGEMHYVSTSSAFCRQHSQETSMPSDRFVKNLLKRKQTSEIPEIVSVNNEGKYELLFDSELETNSKKKSRAAYMREYRAKKTDSLTIAKLNENKRQYRAKESCREEKAKINAYKRQYRAKNTSPDKRAKINEYNQQYRLKKRCLEENRKHNAYLKNYRLASFFMFKVDGRAPLREVQCPPTDSLIH